MLFASLSNLLPKKIFRRHSDDNVDYSFVRWACVDGLALMGD